MIDIDAPIEDVFDLRINGVLYAPKSPELAEPRTMDSAELFQHFRNFRYAKMCVNGLGSVYTDALRFIDDEVKIRVAEILKGMK